MRTVLYLIPFFYDQADESWPVKYVHDRPISTRNVVIRKREDGTPIDADVEVTADEATHDELRDYEDVVVIRDPA